MAISVLTIIFSGESTARFSRKRRLSNGTRSLQRSNLLRRFLGPAPGTRPQLLGASRLGTFLALTVLDCSARRLAVSNCSLRSLRCSLGSRRLRRIRRNDRFEESALSLEALRRLLLQIGGANIACADRALIAAYFVVTRRRKACPLAPFTLLAPLAEAGAR